MKVPDALKNLPPFGGDETRLLLIVRKRWGAWSFSVVNRSSGEKRFVWSMPSDAASVLVASVQRMTDGVDSFASVEYRKGTESVHVLQTGKYYSFAVVDHATSKRFVWSMHQAEVAKLNRELQRMLTGNAGGLLTIEGVSIGGPPDPASVV